MKKNIIFLVVDSFLFKKIGNTKFGPSSTPFLDSIKEKCMFANNMYSQGPFTESGNKALLTGSDSLNNRGYMHNLNESGSIYLDVFKKNDYVISEFFIPYYLYSKKHFDNIDYQFFTTDFLIISVWGNRLKHFSELQKKRPLTEEEYSEIYKQLDLTFEAWDNFLENKIPSKYKYIQRLVKDFPFDDNRKILQEEREKYLNNKKEYADSFLLKGETHELFTRISTCDYGNYLDEGFIKKNFYEKRSHLIKRIRKLQLKYSLRNSKLNHWQLIKSCFNCVCNRKVDGYLKSVLFLLFSGKIASLYHHHDFIKMLPSCRVMLRGAVEQLINNKTGKPMLIHLHPEELHNRTSFFSYDISDEQLIDYEMTTCENHLDCLKDNYCGEIVYDLALLYIDDCIKEAFESLKGSGMLERTLFVITSDHGYSYDCTPLRDQFVNNHHTENYHIPLIIYDGTNPSGRIINSYHTSKDVLPTIYDLCGIDKPGEINGKSILNKDNQNEFAISEYMGGGCPDMINRPIHFMIRDRKYLVCYIVKMIDDFEKGELVEVYDLEKDPDEVKNIVGDRSLIDRISYLLDILKVRKEKIFQSYMECKVSLRQ